MFKLKCACVCTQEMSAVESALAQVEVDVQRKKALAPLSHPLPASFATLSSRHHRKNQFLCKTHLHTGTTVYMMFADSLLSTTTSVSF